MTSAPHARAAARREEEAGAPGGPAEPSRGTAAPICVLLHDLRSGGAERMVLRLANAMAERGHRVDLVLVRHEGPLAAHVAPAVRLVDLGATRTLAAITRFRRYLRRARPRVVLSALVHINVAAAIATRLLRRRPRLIVSERNTFSCDVDPARPLTVRAAYALAPWAYCVADRVVAVSEGVARDLVATLGLARARIDVLNNPVVFPDLALRAAEPVGAPWWPAASGPLILGVGRLAPQKGFDILTRAFARLRQRREARLIILGEGGERRALEALAGELGCAADVTLPGYLDNPLAVMARADVFVLSSRFEGSPNVLVEAMACGTAVVATDCPSGPREILDGGRLGPIVPVDDPEALARAIESQLDRPTARGALVEAASHFSLERAVTAYLDVLLDRPRHGGGASTG